MIISTSHPSHFSSLRLTSDLVLSLHVRRQTLDGLFGETGLNCVSVELLGSASKRTVGINENLGFFSCAKTNFLYIGWTWTVKLFNIQGRCKTELCFLGQKNGTISHNSNFNDRIWSVGLGYTHFTFPFLL